MRNYIIVARVGILYVIDRPVKTIEVSSEVVVRDISIFIPHSDGVFLTRYLGSVWWLNLNEDYEVRCPKYSNWLDFP